MTSKDDRIGIRARIVGRVQGVCFRAWTQREAERRGLAGWVRNEPDGTVRALFVGPREDVTEMLEHCRKGPAAARVSDVETEQVVPVPELVAFRVTG